MTAAQPDASDAARRRAITMEPDAECERCGAMALEWRKCKLVCTQCRTIVKSCADL